VGWAVAVSVAVAAAALVGAVVGAAVGVRVGRGVDVAVGAFVGVLLAVALGVALATVVGAPAVLVAGGLVGVMVDSSERQPAKSPAVAAILMISRREIGSDCGVASSLCSIVIGFSIDPAAEKVRLNYVCWCVRFALAWRFQAV
jgi:hypothetical protein